MSGFFESLYSQFLLRDLLAKVVPGFLVLLAALVFFYPLFPGILFALTPINIVLGLAVLYAICFVVAMALQFIGERVGLVRIYVWPPKGKGNMKLSLDKYREFLESLESLRSQHLLDTVLRQRERFAILKEMAGNFALSLSILTLSLFFAPIAHPRSPSLFLFCLSPVTALLAVVLFKQNQYHAKEQRVWEDSLQDPKR